MSTTPIGDTPSEALVRAQKLLRDFFADDVGYYRTRGLMAEVSACIDTALTPPPVAAQAEPSEAKKLAGVLRGMVECGRAPDDLWERDQPDGDPFVARAAELLEQFAALAPQADQPTPKERAAALREMISPAEPISASAKALLNEWYDAVSGAPQADPIEQPRGMVGEPTDAEIDAVFSKHFSGFVTLQNQRDAAREILSLRAPQASREPSGELPPLPGRRAIRAGHGFPKAYALAYTADQMQEYARAALATREEAQPSYRLGASLTDEVLHVVVHRQDADITTVVIAERIPLNSLELSDVLVGGREEAAPDASDGFPYARTFNAISAAIKWREHKTIEISVKKFVQAWHEGRTSTPPAAAEPDAHADWSAFSPTLQPPAPPTAAEQVQGEAK